MNLEQIRKRIDKIDAKLVALIAERQSYMADVGKYKRRNNLPYYQPEREKEIIKSKKGMAKKSGADQNLIKKIFILIFKNSRKIQKLTNM